MTKLNFVLRSEIDEDLILIQPFQVNLALAGTKHHAAYRLSAGRADDFRSPETGAQKSDAVLKIPEYFFIKNAHGRGEGFHGIDFPLSFRTMKVGFAGVNGFRSLAKRRMIFLFSLFLIRFSGKLPELT